MKTDKIHPSRIISQKLERAAFNAGRPAVTAVLCWLAVKAMKPYRRIKTLMTVQRRIRAKARSVQPRITMLKEAERTAPGGTLHAKIASLSLAKAAFSKAPAQ